MASNAKSQFDEQKGDIDQLWAIHQRAAGEGPGRKHGVEVLNKAAIVFITACWESYVEDVCLEAFDFILTNATSHDCFPARVRTLASKAIREDLDETKVWLLAGEGWKQILVAHKEVVKAEWLDKLNTPKTAQVNGLFKKMLGLSDLSGSWSWQGMSSQDASSKLDDYIIVRGNIAHRVSHDETVYKDWGTDYLAHVVRLVNATDQAVSSHVASLTGSIPW
jgi:hypothetical protein